MPDIGSSPSKPGQRDLGFAENFMLSGTAAVISKTVFAPIERVKLLIQNQDEMLKMGRLDKPYKGIIECTTRTYHLEGVLPFWRGNLANCIRYFPTQALNFAFKEPLRRIFKVSRHDPYVVSGVKNIVAGGTGSALSLAFVYSLDYARTRLANDALSAQAKGSSRQFNGLIDVYMKTLRSDGIVGLYRGFVISCVGIVIYRGALFGFYDTLKPILIGEDAGIVISFLLGWCLATVAGLVAYPFDTVRRRMMMTSGEQVKYKGSVDCTMQIIRKEGSMSLMKGAGANIIRGVGCAGVLAGFDQFKAWYLYFKFGE